MNVVKYIWTITKYDWRIYVKNRKENVKPQT